MFKKYKKRIKDALNDFKSIKTVYKQIPNILTSTRLFSPFILMPFFISGNLMSIIVAIALIASTDFFDGLLARKFNVTSELGKDLDAVSDKVFALTLIAPLVLQNPLYLTNVILELFIGISNLQAEFNNKKPKTIFIGKVKTASLSLNIILGYLNLIFSINPIILSIVFSSTIVLQLISTYKYIKINNKKDETIIEDNTLFSITNDETNDKEKTNVLEIENDIEKEIEEIIVYKNDNEIESKVKVKKLEKKLGK